jgi:hypothetical protein
VWRRLQSLGAVAVRNAAYVLPDLPQTREDMAWLAREIEGLGGQATLFTASGPDAATDDDIRAAFRSAREPAFRRLRQRIERVRARVPAAGSVPGPARLRLGRLVRQLADEWRSLEAITFVDTPGREEVRDMMNDLERRLAGPPAPASALPAARRLDPARFRGKVWQTRPRPGIDRMASAWLIRRFIDPRARFRFGESPDPAGGIAFDMYGVEFSHQGSACTFEVLAARFGIDDAAVARLGRIAHDLDFKEERFGLAETAGVGRLVEGLRRRHADDRELLERGIEMIDALATAFADPAPARGSRRAPSARRGRASRRPKR